jgi:hypothetical protein
MLQPEKKMGKSTLPRNFTLLAEMQDEHNFGLKTQKNYGNMKRERIHLHFA